MPPILFSNHEQYLWNAFESHVYELLQKKFSECKISVQPNLSSGLRPDFVLECDSKIVVVDAKAKERISKRDIIQIVDYVYEIDADYGIIFVVDYTEVSESIENFAVANAIEIEYTDWKGGDIN